MLEKILVKEVIGPIVVILSCLLIYHLIKKIINKMMKVKLSRIDQRRQKTINVLILNIIKYFLIIIIKSLMIFMELIILKLYYL